MSAWEEGRFANERRLVGGIRLTAMWDDGKWRASVNGNRVNVSYDTVQDAQAGAERVAMKWLERALADLRESA